MAALLVVLPAHAEVPVSDAARSLFREGVQHLKAEPPDYREAYDAFRAAYDDSPSPKILGNLGLAAAKLERDGEAIEAYQRYLDEAGAKSQAERWAIERDLKELRARLSRLRLVGLPPGCVILDVRRGDDVSVENRYEPASSEVTLGLHAGTHELTLEAEGYESDTITIELAPGADESRVIDLAVVPDEDPVVPEAGFGDDADRGDSAEGLDDGAPVAMWVAVGATAALGIATGVAGGLAASNFSSFEEARDQGDLQRADELRDSGETLNIAGDVLLGVTAAAAATSIVLVILELSGEDSADDTNARLIPIVTPQGASLGITGVF